MRETFAITINIKINIPILITVSKVYLLLASTELTSTLIQEMFLDNSATTDVLEHLTFTFLLY